MNNPLKVTITSGSESQTFDASSNKTAAVFSRMLLRELAIRSYEGVKVNVEKLRKELPDLIENSYVEAVQYAARSLIGRSSPRGISNRNAGYDAQINYISVAKWKALSARTIREQNEMHNTKNSGKFYLQTGELRKELMRMARSYVKKTGIVRVTVRGPKGQFQKIIGNQLPVSMGSIEVRLLPRVQRASIPGLTSGNPKDFNSDMSFERSLGMSSEAIKKLSGATKGDFVIPGTHRPLMQPVFTYWTMNKIPAQIAQAIDSAANLADLKGPLRKVAKRTGND